MRSVLALGAMLLLAEPATAEPAPPPDPTVRTAARELATQGAEAYERGDFAAAYDCLSRAYSLYPVPSIAIMQARSLVKLGRLVEALDRYEETRRMSLAEDAPEAYRTAVREATEEAAALRVRVPRLAIRVRRNGSVPPGIEVLMDGRVLPQALLDVDYPVDPGSHVVTVKEPGHSPNERSVRLGEKERLVLDISLERTEGNEADESVSATSWQPGSRFWWGAGALGGGATALAVTILSGAKALDRKSDLDGVCTPGCPEGSQGDIDDFRAYRTISYVAGATTAVLAGLGSYLVLTDKGSQRSMALGVSPQGLSVRGTF